MFVYLKKLDYCSEMKKNKFFIIFFIISMIFFLLSVFGCQKINQDDLNELDETRRFLDSIPL